MIVLYWLVAWIITGMVFIMVALWFVPPKDIRRWAYTDYVALLILGGVMGFITPFVVAVVLLARLLAKGLVMLFGERK